MLDSSLRHFIGFISVFFSLLITSCQTNSHSARDLAKDDNRLKNFEDMGVEDIPKTLWSPTQRQMSARYYFLIGEYERLKGNYSKSRDVFEQAYNLDANSFLGLKMIESKANTGHIDEALQQCRKMVLLYPKSSLIHNLYGQLLVNRGVYAKAIKHYEKSIELDPKGYQPYLNLIRLYQFQKEYEKAIIIAQDLVKMDPSFGDGWSTLAKLYLATSQKKRALKPAKRAYELKSQDPEKVLIYALALEFNGKSKEAVQLYEILFRFNPTNEELIGRMVDLYRQIGDLNDALSLLKEAENSLKKVGPGLKMQQAFILWELRRYEEAASILVALSKKYPDSDRVLYLAALGYEKLGDSSNALVTFQRISNISSYKIHAEFRSVKILQQEKRYEEAMAIIRRVVKSGFDRSSDFYSIGAAIYGEQERYSDAIQLIKDGVKSFPKKTTLLFLLGVYYEKNQEISECIDVMKQVIEKDPRYSSAYNYLGYLYAERGENLDEAEELIKKALEIKPKDGFYMDSLAWVYFQKGDYKKAEAILIEANKLTPNEGVILEHLAEVYKKQNNNEKALEFFRKAIRGRLDERDRVRIKTKLKELEAQIKSLQR